jgi:hypothetical protein
MKRAAAICSVEEAEGGRARIMGFSTRPSSAVERAGGVSVVRTGMGEDVDVTVGVGEKARGKEQSDKNKEAMSRDRGRINLRFIRFPIRL